MHSDDYFQEIGIRHTIRDLEKRIGELNQKLADLLKKRKNAPAASTGIVQQELDFEVWESPPLNSVETNDRLERAKIPVLNVTAVDILGALVSVCKDQNTTGASISEIHAQLSQNNKLKRDSVQSKLFYMLQHDLVVRNGVHNALYSITDKGLQNYHKYCDDAYRMLDRNTLRKNYEIV